MDRVIEAFKGQFKKLEPFLDERTKRLCAASMAKELGHGGIKKISEITNLSKETISNGIKELENPQRS